MLAGGRNSRCNSLDYFLLGFFLCARFFLVTPHPRAVEPPKLPTSENARETFLVCRRTRMGCRVEV